MKSSDDHFDWDAWALARWSRQIKIMPVDFINGYGSEIPIRSASTRPAAPKAAAAPQDSFDTTAALKSAQNQTTDVRADKVARASALLADGNYPSDQDLGRLAGFLADKL